MLKCILRTRFLLILCRNFFFFYCNVLFAVCVFESARRVGRLTSAHSKRIQNDHRPDFKHATAVPVTIRESSKSKSMPPSASNRTHCCGGKKRTRSTSNFIQFQTVPNCKFYSVWSLKVLRRALQQSVSPSGKISSRTSLETDNLSKNRIELSNRLLEQNGRG